MKLTTLNPLLTFSSHFDVNKSRSRPEAKGTQLFLQSDKRTNPKQHVAQCTGIVPHNVLIHHPLMCAVVTREMRKLDQSE
mmetsp:Transcript_46612/g.56422  ORF Transcript_46612/g.56422 Transcript_46612/m.56422 type:complete len:80 (-) Transcript_46612:554-793(-)